ncbi:MAG: septum formation family protein [Actinomycetia bacterium]|nr:septum formation family protein [Actinomycetes bacterium]
MTSSQAGPSGGGWWSRLPGWLLFILVFLVGSTLLFAGVIAASVVITEVIDGFEASNTSGGTASAATATTVVADDADALIVGQCLDDDELDRYLAAETFSYLSCDDPHDFEVFFVYEFPTGPYPGDDTVIDDLKAVCRNRFEGYIDRDYESSALDTWSVWPGQGLWESGNRIGECLLYRFDDSKMTGSAYLSGW